MTNQHSVTMLSDLIEQLESDIDRYEISTSQALARAYAAGADQQLELDAKWLDHNALSEAHLKIALMGEVLKEAMRPKPPSLKEQALEQLDGISTCFRITHMGDIVCDKIRAALEALPND